MQGLPRWVWLAALPATLAAVFVAAAALWILGSRGGPAPPPNPTTTVGEPVSEPEEAAEESTVPDGVTAGPAGRDGDASDEGQTGEPTDMTPGSATGVEQTPAVESPDSNPGGGDGVGGRDAIPPFSTPDLGQSFHRATVPPEEPADAYSPGQGNAPGLSEPMTVPLDPERTYGSRTEGTEGTAGTGGPDAVGAVGQMLNREFLRATLAESAVAIEVEGYYPVPAAAGGISLVGFISVDAYPGWERLLTEHREELVGWLEEVATAAAPAAREMPFQLAWAVVDAVAEPPPAFAGHEQSRLPTGDWLVVRPLAATQGLPRDPRVQLRGAGTLKGAESLRPDPEQWA